MSGLRDHLCRRIRLEGPLTVAQYMEECLGHPRYGYYTAFDSQDRHALGGNPGGSNLGGRNPESNDPFGQAGDFITAPEISQMFGELLGLWAAVVWQGMGSPVPFQLAELGPGRGTLMADALRAARGVPGFLESCELTLVEISPALKERQRESLEVSGAALVPRWVDDPAQIPPGPVIVLANEYLDALPIRQFFRTEGGWHERLVGLGTDGETFTFGLSPAAEATPLIPGPLQSAPVGSLVEIAPAALRKVHTLAARIKAGGGAALFIDYGHAASAPGDTLQAVKNHRYHDVLRDPGAADLTAHVDFAQVAHVAEQAGAAVFGPIPQGQFLSALGIVERAQALSAMATPDQREDIGRALDRLTDGDAMGTLFKVIALGQAGMTPLPGFS